MIKDVSLSGHNIMFRSFQEKAYSEIDGCCPRPYCERCTVEDDEQILVSVSPRILRVSREYSSHSSMVIKNRNTFTVFFKVISTNMSAFIPHPMYGRINPHDKVVVTVPFSVSATPVRHHEEVVILTSVRPFVQLDKKICPYCYECHSDKKQKQHESNLRKSCMDKELQDKISRENESFESKMMVICKYCREHIEIKDVEQVEDHDSRGYQRISGTFAEHRCPSQDNIINEKTEAAQKQKEEKNLHIHKTECQIGKDKSFRTELFVNDVVDAASDCVSTGSSTFSTCYRNTDSRDKSPAVDAYSEKAKEHHSDKEKRADREDMERKITKGTSHGAKHVKTGDFQQSDVSEIDRRKPHIRARVVKADAFFKSDDKDFSDTSSEDFKPERRIRFISEKDMHGSLSKLTDEESEFSTVEIFEKCNKRQEFREILTAVDNKCSQIVTITSASTCLIVFVIFLVFQHIFFCSK